MERLRFLKYIAHGVALLACVGPISLMWYLVFPGGIVVDLLAAALFFPVLFFFGGTLIGLANNAMTRALWMPVEISLRKSLIDGLAFSIVAGLVSSLFTPLLPLSSVAQFLVQTTHQPIVAFMMYYTIVYGPMAFVLGVVGRQIAESWRAEAPYQAKEAHNTIGVIDRPFGISPTIFRDEDRGK